MSNTYNNQNLLQDSVVFGNFVNCDDIKIQQAYSSLSGYEGPSKELYAKLDNNIILILCYLLSPYCMQMLHFKKKANILILVKL